MVPFCEKKVLPTFYIKIQRVRPPFHQLSPNKQHILFEPHEQSWVISKLSLGKHEMSKALRPVWKRIQVVFCFHNASRFCWNTQKLPEPSTSRASRCFPELPSDSADQPSQSISANRSQIRQEPLMNDERSIIEDFFKYLLMLSLWIH